MAIFLFLLLSVICVGSILGMIISRNQAYGALYLVLAFSCLGGLFGMLGASFAAVIQILIYAGAIMVLFIFVIMMINVREGLAPEKKKWTIGAAVFIGFILLAEIILASQGLTASGIAGAPQGTGPADLGRVLLMDYLYPFEITSILIVAALVGAIVLAKKKEKE